MFYILRPQSPSALGRDHPLYLDPNDEYIQRKRREYLAAFHEQQERRAYERAVAAEVERHRARLAALARQERIRRHAAYHRSMAPSAVECADPSCTSSVACADPSCTFNIACPDHSCAPNNIVRGRYNRPRAAPQPQKSAPAPVPRCSRPLREEATLERLFTELFDHSVRILLSSDLPAPVLTDIQEPEVEAHKNTQPTAAPAEPTEGHWSDAVRRTRSVAAISQISRTFDSLKRTFIFPAGPLAPFEGSEAPRLAYNPTNASIHAYEHALSELLTKLDAVESFGFRGIRERRKEVVVQIEKELEELEKKVSEAITVGAAPVIKTTEDRAAEDYMMVEAEDAAVGLSDDAQEIAEGYELDTDDAATVVPAPVPVEFTLVTDSPIVGSGAQTVSVETAQPEADAIAFDVTPAEQPTFVEPEPTQPKHQEVGSDSTITEPAVEPEPAPQATEYFIAPEVVPNEAVATPAPQLLFQTLLDDATVTSSESESGIEDAVDVTVSSDSDVEVTLDAGEAASDSEKDFEIL